MALPGAQPVETMETVRRLLKTERPNDFKVSLVVSNIHPYRAPVYSKSELYCLYRLTQ